MTIDVLDADRVRQTIATAQDIIDVVATAAKQDVGNAALATLHADLVALVAALDGTHEIGGVDLTKAAGTALATGSGAATAGTPRVIAATDSPEVTALASLVARLPASLGGGGGLKTESAAYRSTVTINRPATTPTYDAGDVVGATVAAFEFQNIGPAAGGFVYLDTTRLTINIASVPAGMANMRMRLYSATPPSALADAATWDLPAGDRTVNRGYLDLGTPIDVGSTLEVEALNHGKLIYVPPGGSLFAYLVTSGSYLATSGAVYEIEMNSVGV